MMNHNEQIEVVSFLIFELFDMTEFGNPNTALAGIALASWRLRPMASTAS